MRTFLLASLLLMVGYQLGFSTARHKSCICQNPEFKKYMPKDKLPDDSSYTNMKVTISCCKDIILGNHDPGASIQWSFNGETYSEGWTSSLKPYLCGDETITSSLGKKTDSGNYSCTIIASNGTSKTVSMTLTIEENKKHRDTPGGIESSSDKLALVGETVDFKCQSYIGTNDTTRVSVYWVKKFPNQTLHAFANQLPNVNVTTMTGSGSSSGMIKTVLMISSVREMHYGFYQCRITTLYASFVCNYSLKRGIPETEASIQWYKTTLVVVGSVLGVLVLLLLGWCRWGRFLYLYWRHGKHSEDHEYDVFLIHGESASFWVWSVLLPALEDSFGYTCFLPQRDMCAGTMVSESILEALTKCRHVVVVMTPCLLDSPWGIWATSSGIQTVLTSKTRILALVHEEESFVNNPLIKNPLLSVLKVVRKIKVPEDIVWDKCNKKPQEQHQDHPNVSTQKPRIHKTELKLVMPEPIVRNISSNALSKQQKLPNMINGNTTVAKQDLSYENKKIDFSDPTVFTIHDEGQDELGSPSSVTPFILIPHNKTSGPSDDSVCHSVCWCFRTSCIRNPEEQFWQILRLHIGPPSIKALHIKDTTCCDHKR